MQTLYIGLGSNLGESKQIIANAFEALQCFAPVTASHLYGSKPQGPQNQPDYVNAVAKLHTKWSAEQVLKQLHIIEAANLRTREGERWGARTLDLDILLYANQIINLPHLIIPHQQMLKRQFVLYPLFEIAPALVLPNKQPLINYIDTVFFNRMMDQANQNRLIDDDLWLLEK